MIPEKTGYKVYEIMSTNPVTISGEKSIRDCAKVMAKYDIGSLIVVTGKRIIGIITEEDIVRKFVINNLDADRIKVSDIMTVEPFTIEPEEDIRKAIEMMKDLEIRHIPVVKDEEVVGMITAKDIIHIQPELLETFKIEPEDEAIILDEEDNCDVCGRQTRVIYQIDGMNVCEKCYKEYLRKRKF